MALQGSDHSDESDEDQKEEDRYCDDPAYRLQCGPNIERFGDFGYDESLVGLQLSLPFGHGECRGTVTGTTKCKYGQQMFAVSWTCPQNGTEEFESILRAEGVLGCYYRGKTRPSWMSDEKYARTLESPLFKAPANSKLVNFELPFEADYYFPWVEGERGNRWWATLSRLNDPAAASMYAPGMDSYPLPLLLAIIILTMEESGDSTVIVPDVKTAAKAEVYALADRFARRLTGAENRAAHGHGYGELQMLEKLVGEVAKTVPAGATTDESWGRAYVQVEALLLTLSHKFEEVHSNWQMADDPERISSVCASVVLAVAAVLLHPPSAATEARIKSDFTHLTKHMKAGTFVAACEVDSFAAEFPDAARAWSLLCELGQPQSGDNASEGGTKRAAPGRAELTAAIKRHKDTIER